jgi:DNA modification methylase
VSGLGKVKHREFAMASGEMNTREFTQFLQTVFMRLAEFSSDGSLHFICMDWRHMRELLDAAAKPYREIKNLCVWSKTNAGMGSLYRSQHELIFVFKNGSAPHINNVELGRFGRNRTNVWHYPGASSFGKDRASELVMHPTVKPVRMVADAILDCSKHGSIVLDAFAGSGTTLIAAEKTGRRGYGKVGWELWSAPVLKHAMDLWCGYSTERKVGKLIFRKESYLAGLRAAAGLATDDFAAKEHFVDRSSDNGSSAATAKGLCRPSAFGMYVRRDGDARYAPR